MPKEFYTERDIEDMVKRGILSLEINDNVVLTDLAYEKANRLGMQLVRDKPDNPPGAPVRPYISQQQARVPARVEPQPVVSFPPAFRPALVSAAQPVPAPQADGVELHQRIRSAVVARLGSQVDANLLDVIITRVLQNTGIK
jgi:hypothetical protein